MSHDNRSSPDSRGEIQIFNNDEDEEVDIDYNAAVQAVNCKVSPGTLYPISITSTN